MSRSFFLIFLLPVASKAMFIDSTGSNVPGIGSIEALDNIIASAAQSSPFTFSLPLSMMGSTMSQFLASPAMALNRMRANQHQSRPLMIEIPSHVLNDFSAPPAGNFDVMPLHKCKYCSGKGRLRGPAAAARLPPYRHQPQKYNPNSHQSGKGVQMQGYPSKGGYNRPVVQQQMHEYPTKGGSRSNNNQKIVIVVLHMKNEKLMAKNPYGGSKGASYDPRDEQQQIQQMRYAAPTANNQIYFDAGSFTPMQNGPRIERFDGPASASVPAVLSPVTTTTRKPASSEMISSINVPSVEREVNHREPVRDVSSDAFHAEEEIITQRKEEDSDGPTTPAPVSRPALVSHWGS